ncbi:hypothetical protein [Fulvivirga sedimenti]|uniref:Glycerophosphoryl diester phosphodiesterase membrane domain-containing protein n=1 Tax=Fulvivirga sedimenti TaxID=2879465 RepID=A0A9X1KW49_9BACT|nr:hypothetical protein [Fulvivirga sedimenti]MCA6074360.1 hypothetical protein [Fulvivirga sedimenti]
MQQGNLLELHKRRDFSAKLSASVDFIRLHARPFIKALTFISGPFIILGAILMADGYGQLMNLSALSDPGTAPVVLENMFGLGIPIISGLIFLFVAGTLLIATVYQYVVIYDEKKSTDISVSEVWQRVKSFMWTVLGSLVIWSIALVIIYLGGVFLVVAFSQVNTFFGVITGIALGIILIYLIVAFSLVFVVQAYDKTDVFTSFGRALKLIRGKWWSTFGLIFVAGLIQSFVSYIFMIPWYVTFFAGTLHAAEETGLSEPSLLFQIANYTTLSLAFLASNLLNAFPLLALGFQYFNLVELKEARGLMNKIETFGQQDTSDEDEEHY